MMEYNIHKYQFHQDGKDYVVSTGLVYDRIRITCQENLALDGPFYSNEFSLYELQSIHQFFKLTQSLEEALAEINKGIERQRSGLKLGTNDTMYFLGYLIIGTDNDVYTLQLKRNFEPNKYGIFTPPSTGAADLILSTNYKVDGNRLNIAEMNNGNLQRDQTMIEEELDRVIPQINKLKRLSMDIEEENALIKERLRILQKQLEQKKYNVIRLKEENANLKRENQNLINEINNQQNSIRNKQALQTKIQIKSRPNVMPQTSAVVSKFEQTALRTFLPRTGAKPQTEDYTQNMDYNYITSIPTTTYSPPIITEEIPYTTYTNTSYQYPNVLPTLYEQPTLIEPQPIVPQPVTLLRYSNRSHMSNISYNNKIYKVSLKSPSQDIIYKTKVYDPNLNTKNITYNNNNISNNKIIDNTRNDATLNTNNPNQNLVTLTDKINAYADKNKVMNSLGDFYGNTNLNSANNVQGNLNNNDGEYSKPIGSRMPKANLGSSGSNIENNKKSKRMNSPKIGYSSYNPDIDNNNKN